MHEHRKLRSPGIDPRALREEVGLREPVDAGSTEFLRFVIRFSEALNHDFRVDDLCRLVTLSGCLEFLEGQELGPKV